MRKTNIVLGLWIAAALFAVTGCGSKSGAVPVEGTVTWKGQPVAGLIVEFTPTQGNRPSQGVTDTEGHFRLNYTINEVGAEVGPHDVTFGWVEGKEGEKATDAVKEILKLHGAKGKPIQVEVTGKDDNLKIDLPQA